MPNEFLTLFTRASKLMRSAVDQAMSRHGVRVGQNMVLEALWQDDGIAPGELAARLDVAAPTIVKSATRMETAGLLVRRPDPSDARMVRLFLTEQARAIRGEIEQERDALAGRALSVLTDEERRHLMTALRKIVAEFSNEVPPTAHQRTDNPC